jgi:GNAT superfamily N-acetyltransferase
MGCKISRIQIGLDHDSVIRPGRKQDHILADQFSKMTNIMACNLSFPSLADKLDVIVRSPTSDDIAGLARLFSEMQRHYRRPVTDEQAVEAAMLACQSVRTTFDPRVLIATLDGSVIGSIVLNVTFPAYELSRSLYIRDLYVARSMRRCGVGQTMVRAAARLTYAQGFSALDWTTETGNSAARQMYESCGARVLERTYYRLAREDMNE